MKKAAFILFFLFFSLANCFSQQLVMIEQDAHKIKANDSMFINKPLSELLKQVRPPIKRVTASPSKFIQSRVGYFIFNFVDQRQYDSLRSIKKVPITIVVYVKEYFDWDFHARPKGKQTAWTAEDATKYGNLTIVGFRVYGDDVGPANNIVQGSWINSKIIAFYDSGLQSCNGDYFGDDQVMPLWISFKSPNVVELQERYEQPFFSFNRSARDSNVFLLNTSSSLTLHLIGDSLEILYNGTRSLFHKVSPGYSRDIFSVFVLNKIFKEHKSYRIANFGTPTTNKTVSTIIDRNHLPAVMKSFFRSSSINFPQMASLSINGKCLPVITMYHDNPVANLTLGILIEGNTVSFIDQQKEVRLVLTANE